MGISCWVNACSMDFTVIRLHESCSSSLPVVDSWVLHADSLSSCVCNMNVMMIMMHLKVNSYKQIFTKMHNASADAVYVADIK